MRDDDSQAGELRRRLDGELRAVRATDDARDRLAGALGREASRRPSPRIRRVVVPLASAALVAAVVTVPSLLRTQDEGPAVRPGGPPGTSVPAVPAPFPADPTPSPSISGPAPEPTAAPSPTQTGRAPVRGTTLPPPRSVVPEATRSR